MRNDTESDVIRYLAESTGSKKTYCSRCILLRIASLDQDKRCSDKERKSGWLFFVHCYDAITFSSPSSHLYIGYLASDKNKKVAIGKQ